MIFPLFVRIDRTQIEKKWKENWWWWRRKKRQYGAVAGVDAKLQSRDREDNRIWWRWEFSEFSPEDAQPQEVGIDRGEFGRIFTNDSTPFSTRQQYYIGGIHIHQAIHDFTQKYAAKLNGRTNCDNNAEKGITLHSWCE